MHRYLMFFWSQLVLTTADPGRQRAQELSQNIEGEERVCSIIRLNIDIDGM